MTTSPSYFVKGLVPFNFYAPAHVIWTGQSMIIAEMLVHDANGDLIVCRANMPYAFSASQFRLTHCTSITLEKLRTDPNRSSKILFPSYIIKHFADIALKAYLSA